MCHKTASLVANALERAGIATVVIGTMHKPLQVVPRAVVTRYINAPVGPAGDARTHRQVIAEALDLLQYATEPRLQTLRGAS